MRSKHGLKMTALNHLCHSILAPLCQKKLARRDYFGALMILHKADRLDGFKIIARYLTDRQYWRLLAGVWTSTESPTFRLAEWQRLFRSRRPGRKYLMDAAERQTLAKLPEVVRIYRACSEQAVGSLAWTLDRSRAEFFRHYYALRGISCQLWCGDIGKRHILAF